MFQDRVYVQDLVFILTRQKKKVTVGCKSKTSLKKKRLRSNSAFNFWGSEREREREIWRMKEGVGEIDVKNRARE